MQGSVLVLTQDSNKLSTIQVLLEEALSSAKIESELLRRDSLQSSLRKYLGLKSERVPTSAAEYGMAEMLANVHLNHSKELTHNDLYLWHEMLFNGRRRDLKDIGSYRTHKEPVQVVSGNLNNSKVFYEAPPSVDLLPLMDQFIDWFNAETSNTNTPLVVVASVAHLYFEQLHPFEDGNGRIGRALCEKAISKRLGFPSLTGLSLVLEENKSAYYEALQKSNYALKINAWLAYHCPLLLKAQEYSQAMVNLTLHKTKLFTHLGGKINDPQEKVLLRLFDAGVKGFKGGLSAKNYQTISKAPSATATRDLTDLVEKEILVKTGKLKGTRYHLNKELKF